MRVAMPNKASLKMIVMLMLVTTATVFAPSTVDRAIAQGTQQPGRCDYSRSTAALSGGQVIVPSVRSTGSITCVLGFGDTGRAVKRLQMSLNACYYDLHFVIDARLVEDGTYGSLTREAVKDVQRHVGVGVDGVYGPKTRDAMLHEGATLLPPCNWVA